MPKTITKEEAELAEQLLDVAWLHYRRITEIENELIKLLNVFNNQEPIFNAVWNKDHTFPEMLKELDIKVEKNSKKKPTKNKDSKKEGKK